MFSNTFCPVCGTPGFCAYISSCFNYRHNPFLLQEIKDAGKVIALLQKFDAEIFTKKVILSKAEIKQCDL